MTYDELYEQKKVEAMSSYIGAVAEGDMNKAYNIFGQMMGFKFISDDNTLLSKANIGKFQKAGIDKDHRFHKDYRVDNDFVPDNLFYKVPVCDTIDIMSEAHWGKRVELVYEGDVIMPEKNYEFIIMAKTSLTSARGALKGMKELYKRESHMELEADWNHSIESGKSTIYEVALGNGQQFSFNTLGFVYANVLKNNITLTIILSNSNMMKTHINIKRAYEGVADVLARNFVEAGVNIDNIKVKYLCNIKKAREMQAREYSKLPPLNYDRFCEIENKKIAEAKELAESRQ